MTKEELKQEAEQDAGNVSGIDLSTTLMVTKNKTDAYRLGRFDGYLAGAEPREKRIEELEEKISVLLSCKNCPENKGGFICVKEYENKCLAQKIQYIKELKEENENLKKTYRKQRNKRIDDLQKENAELDCQKNRNKFCYSCANATERCFRNEIGCPCEKYKSYKDENAELKKQLEMSNKVYNDNLDYSHHIEDQLTNAKEIICEYVRLANLEKEDTIAIWQLYHKAEQFLNSEVEK